LFLSLYRPCISSHTARAGGLRDRQASLRCIYHTVARSLVLAVSWVPAKAFLNLSDLKNAPVSRSNTGEGWKRYGLRFIKWVYYLKIAWHFLINAYS
jgi:hypothetical protein